MLERSVHGELATFSVHEFYLCRCKIWRGGNDIQMLEMDLANDGFGDRSRIQKHIIDRRTERLPLQSNSARGITLGISVNEQYAPFCRRKARREIHCGRGLTYTTLLIGNRNNPSHEILYLGKWRR